MEKKTELGLSVLFAALVAGVMGNALLQATPWGINVLLWVGAVVMAVAVVARWRQVSLAGQGGWLVPLILFFAAALAWRDSLTLQWLNTGALCAAAAIAALRARGGSIRAAGLMEYLSSAGTVSLHVVMGFFPFCSDEIEWKEVPRNRGYGTALAIGRGLAIALPLLILFGGLFAAADAHYEAILTGLFDWNADELLSHFLGTLICAWVAVGLLRVALWVDEPAKSVVEKVQGASLGITEVAVVLAALNTLFLSFVLVQIPYFFGGADRVIDPSGPTFAEYARRGFFELVAVTALVLPLLLLAHGWLRKEDRRHERLFRLLAAALVAQLFVIMTSALHRMLLYQSAYGLTELRLYVTAFMGWLAAVFFWFAVTVLRGQRHRFAFGALAAAFVAIALLNRLNPDAFIARANTTRAQTVQRFDGRYVTSLSADAVPALIEALPTLSDSQRRVVARAILARWSPPPQRDWRTWNWGRSQAWAAVASNHGMLRQMAGMSEVARARTE